MPTFILKCFCALYFVLLAYETSKTTAFIIDKKLKWIYNMVVTHFTMKNHPRSTYQRIICKNTYIPRKMKKLWNKKVFFLDQSSQLDKNHSRPSSISWCILDVFIFHKNKSSWEMKSTCKHWKRRRRNYNYEHMELLK